MGIRVWQILRHFKNGKRTSHSYLLRQRITPNEIVEMIELGYIVLVGDTEYGNKQYMITELGKEARSH